MKTFVKTFKSGLRLVLEQNDKNVIAANILFNVGSNNEQREEEGYSHFIEHLNFKSSEKFSTGEIMERLTSLGADFNAYTSKTTTRFIFKCLRENFESCFEIYADMLLHSKFLEAEVDSERNVVIEEIKKYEDDPVEIMFQKACQTYFAGTSFAHDVLGSEDSIAAATPEKLLKYKRKYYIPANAIISVAGNIELEELERIVKKYFDAPGEAEPEKINFSEVEPTISSKYVVFDRNDSQANVCLQIRGVTYSSKDKYVADLFSSILGGSSNSRLYKRIREQLGLVYTIYSYCEIEAQNGQIFVVFGTRPKNVRRIMQEIRKIFDELAEGGVTEAELAAAKNLKISSLAFSSEACSDIAETNGSFVRFEGMTKSTKERSDCYRAVTASQVGEFAKRIAAEQKFCVVAVGKGVSEDDLSQF